MTTSDHFGFFFFYQIREEPTIKHPKENSLNLEEDLWRRPIELRAEKSTHEEILIEWRLQNGPITKSGVLPLTT